MARSKTVSLSTEQWALVQNHLDWAEKLADKECWSLANPAIDLDVCRATAEDGLIEAAQKFEGRNGATFKTYGRIVITWRIRDLVSGKNDPGRYVRLPENFEEVLVDGPDSFGSGWAGAGNQTQRKARQPAYGDEEEQVWQAWHPQMQFSAGRAREDYQILRGEVWKLTSKGCQLAFLLSTSQCYAFLCALLAGRESRRSPPETNLQKRVAHIRATRESAVKKAADLAEELRNLQNAAQRFHLDLPEVDSVLPHFDDLPQTLGRFTEAFKGAQLPVNTHLDLVAWRRSQLLELVSHAKQHGVKQMWKPLACLVSCWSHGAVDVDYSSESPHLVLKEGPTRVSRTAEELRLEYNHALQELNGPRIPPQKRSTSRKRP